MDVRQTQKWLQFKVLETVILAHCMILERVKFEMTKMAYLYLNSPIIKTVPLAFSNYEQSKIFSVTLVREARCFVQKIDILNLFHLKLKKHKWRLKEFSDNFG